MSCIEGVIRAMLQLSDSDEPFTPFDENENPHDPEALGFQTVGRIFNPGRRMVIPDLDVDYQWTPVVVANGESATPPTRSPSPSAREPVDIVDRIDELVNDQLANYGNRSGYDHNVNQDLCPHCGREWHGLKITARIEQMRALGHYDEDYCYADDDSEVLCEGSEFIGPMKYGHAKGGTTQVAPGAAWINISAWLGTSQDRWWRTRIPGDPWRVTNRVDEATVQIGAQEIVVNDARVDFNNGHIDVRCVLPPSFGGTWEPITAPVVLQHPDGSRP